MVKQNIFFRVIKKSSYLTAKELGDFLTHPDLSRPNASYLNFAVGFLIHVIYKFLIVGL
jgi:hypothetical protein